MEGSSRRRREGARLRSRRGARRGSASGGEPQVSMTRSRDGAGRRNSRTHRRLHVAQSRQKGAGRWIRRAPTSGRSAAWCSRCWPAVAFVGEDFADTLKSIMRDSPAWDALPAGTPARVKDLLARCLEKGPAQAPARHQPGAGRRSKATRDAVGHHSARGCRSRGWSLAASRGCVACGPDDRRWCSLAVDA